MSWLFGGGGNPPPPNNDNDDDYEDGGYDDNDNDNDNYDDLDRTKVIADFDATALMEGAKALKEIDASSNSKEVLKLALQQEKTKQQNSRLREQQLIQQNMQYKQQMLGKQHENEMKRDEHQQKMWQERMEQEARQKAQMEREAMEQKKNAQNEWLQKQRQLNEENLQRQKKVEAEIEMKRRESMDYQAGLDRETVKIRARAETDGKMKVERENEDIHLRSQKLNREQERETSVMLRQEDLKAYSEFFSGLRDLVTDKDKMQTIGLTIVGIAGGVYALRQSISTIGSQIEKRLGKPSLIRETSRWSYKDLRLKNMRLFSGSARYQSKELKKRIKDLNSLTSTKETIEDIDANESGFGGIILSPDVHNKIKFVTRSTQQTKLNNAPFRHLLIYGPPGTGKTLFARMLAQQSGLDYAVITGADFAQLGTGAVTELHKTFDWAETSKKGTILFIDEADAFLRKGRESDKMSENMRNALSAFLYRTGTETKEFMIVLASNVPEALDKAVLDRIDDMIEFDLPGLNERIKLLRHYFNVYITQESQHANIRSGVIGGSRTIATSGFDEDEFVWDRLAEKTEGFSGRQIAKYMIQVQAAMYGGMEYELTPFLMQQILEVFLKTKAFGLEEDNKDQTQLKTNF